ncbi:MAG: diacylglycerol kinase family protein, partial [Gemmatimonas sp.]
MVNPAAGGGRARARAGAARDALERVGDVHMVESDCRGDETRLALEAHAAGASALVVLGGDGAVTHAARGLIEARSSVPLTMFAAGTANDFARNLQLPSHDYLAMAALVERGTTRRIDAGTVDGVAFVNAAGFGFDAAIVSQVAQRGGHAGRMTYAALALRSLHSYRGFDASVETSSGVTKEFDSTVRRSHPHGATDKRLMLVFANGAYFGGAFCIAPGASVT